MDLRHLRCFVALAEELHFARAAERLHIEQSPLSRTIKELQTELRVQLFERTPKGTRLTWAGQVFQNDVRRIFLAVEQTMANARAAASGYQGTLRIALSDGVVPRRLSELLAKCRLEEPEVEIRLFEVPLSQQVRGLRNDLYDIGFARSDESCQTQSQTDTASSANAIVN
jgi:DNA-binding transcriptional LysR family regulator